MKSFKVPKETKIYVRKQGDFAVILADTLKRKKMSVKALSEKTGISVSRLNKILAGNENLTFKTISKIESVTGDLNHAVQFIREFKETLASAYGIISVEFWEEMYEKINNFLDKERL